LSDGSVFVLKAIDGGYTEFTIADFAAAVPQSGSSHQRLEPSMPPATCSAWPILPTTTVTSFTRYQRMARPSRLPPKRLRTFGGASAQAGVGGGGPYGGLVMDHAGNLFGTDDGRQRLGLRDRICRRRQLRGDADHDRHVQRR